ncbi:MAG: DUF1211 domain-containing protein [Planctomycetes bacterium]|nr:DUF1211 domain-containing protein [Planctomycetota bacterium]
MIREHLFHKRATSDAMFRWRGGELSRLEGLSDCVFAVVLTLLVVSVQVPDTFHELWLTVRDLPIFLVCFVMILMAWHYHYMFFRRYGLEDFLTQVLNGIFLFLILFYAYPLKFLATFLWRLILGESVDPMFALPAGASFDGGSLEQRRWMMTFYGLGVVGVSGALATMVYRAHRLRDALELDELERFLTRASIRTHLITVAIAGLSLCMNAWVRLPGFAGIVYFLMGPAHGLHGFLVGRTAARMRSA